MRGPYGRRRGDSGSTQGWSGKVGVKPTAGPRAGVAHRLVRHLLPAGARSGQSSRHAGRGVSATPAQIAHVTEQLHLNDGFFVQYWHWLVNALHGNLGTSISTGQPVTQQIEQRFPVTFGLVVASAIVALVVCIPVGVISGIRPQGAIDGGARTFTTLGLAVPSFWLAIILVSIFAVHLMIFPTTGYTPITTSFTGWLKDVTLPAVTLGLLVRAPHWPDNCGPR
jgi:ABC-type dipeptide/oligopeptide/nickel transport system permease component